MTPQEVKFLHHYRNMVAAFKAAFPHIEPPKPERIGDWLTRYNDVFIIRALETLQKQPPSIQARFTQESVERAISATLRANAVSSAVAIAVAEAKAGRQ